MKILALSTIIVLFAAILVACSFYSFAVFVLLQRVPQVFHFSTDFGAFPSYAGSKWNMFDKKL